MPNLHDGEEWITVGRIVKPHGIGGVVKVLPTTDDPSRFRLLKTIALRNSLNQKVSSLTIENMNFQQNNLIIKFVEINDRNTAETFRDSELIIERDQCLPLENGAHYIFELVGMDVVNESGDHLGKIKDVLQYPAHDIYTMQYHGTDIMIPAVSEFIRSIDIDAGQVIINPVPGLLPEE
ncbi:MAG: 16S rRNA processing protein RimM [Calditrichaeota bacterium]|nr:MAG: 16S rRNA processing protein RimM [Calditrichota bacterium]